MGLIRAFVCKRKKPVYFSKKKKKREREREKAEKPKKVQVLIAVSDIAAR